MKKEVIRNSNIQLVCGQAKPGASLAFLKNMAFFCREFNEKTKEQNGILVTVKIKVFKDNSYEYVIRKTPTAYLIKKVVGDKKTISSSELEQIAQEVVISLNTGEIDKAKKIIAGTARSFGFSFL
jgi:large subunit ribosomal protein L11